MDYWKKFKYWIEFTQLILMPTKISFLEEKKLQNIIVEYILWNGVFSSDLKSSSVASKILLYHSGKKNHWSYESFDSLKKFSKNIGKNYWTTTKKDNFRSRCGPDNKIGSPLKALCQAALFSINACEGRASQLVFGKKWQYADKNAVRSS